MNITSFGHAAIRVRDLDISEAFYSGILRMPVVMNSSQDTERGFGADAPAPDARTLGVHHVAFVVGNNPAALDAAANHLDRHRIDYRRVAHEEYESLYCHDPDGHLIELYYWPSW